MPEIPTHETSTQQEYRVGTRPTEGIMTVLNGEQFSQEPELMGVIGEQIDEKKRYICAVGNHIEDGVAVDRFLKIPMETSDKIMEPFTRQIKFGNFLKEDGRVKTRGVIKANVDLASGTPYAVMETFSSEAASIGFITSHEDMSLLTKQEAYSCVDTIGTLHDIDVDGAPDDVKEALVHYDGDTNEFYQPILDNLDKVVAPLDAEGETEPYHQVLERRLGRDALKEETIQILEKFRPVLERAEHGEKVFVHGDLAPNNLYVYDNGDVEFLDLEWSGICDNKAIATIIDYGNLRARAWNNTEFREALDMAMMDKYRREGDEEMGAAIVALGILRSHLQLAGFFENYPHDKQRLEEQTQRRESTEADLLLAWDIAGLI